MSEFRKYEDTETKDLWYVLTHQRGMGSGGPYDSRARPRGEGYSTRGPDTHSASAEIKIKETVQVWGGVLRKAAIKEANEKKLADAIHRLNNPAPIKGGMTARELADYQKQFTADARLRLLTIGAEQYSTQSGQKFEGMSVEKLLTEAQEELLDVVNYAAMLAIKLDRLKEALNGRL